MHPAVFAHISSGQNLKEVNQPPPQKGGIQIQYPVSPCQGLGFETLKHCLLKFVKGANQLHHCSKSNAPGWWHGEQRFGPHADVAKDRNGPNHQ